MLFSNRKERKWFPVKKREIIQCAARMTRHGAICLSPRGRPARRFDPQMGSDFESLGISLEARAVILEAWRLIFRISGLVVVFYCKKCLRGPLLPQRNAVTLFYSLMVWRFFLSSVCGGLLWFSVPRDSILAFIFEHFWKPWAFSKTLVHRVKPQFMFRFSLSPYS